MKFNFFKSKNIKLKFSIIEDLKLNFLISKIKIINIFYVKKFGNI